MKTVRLVLVVATVLAFTAGIALAGPTALKLNAGDTAYVCGCGSKCCEVVSKKPGKCACGHDLVKVTVSKVKGNKASYEVAGKKQTVSMKGKYTCPCEGDCCEMISQKPGKCPCGKDLIKVTEKKSKKTAS